MKQLTTTSTDDISDPADRDSDGGETSTGEGGLGLSGLGPGCGGTMSYAAPEVLLGVRPTTGVDMWATGCLLAEVIAGRVLFQTSSVTQQVRVLLRRI